MVLVDVFLLFLAITVTVWIVGLGLYKAYIGAPDLTQQPHFWFVSLVAVGMATLLCFVPLPWGYGLTLLVWLRTARDFQLPLLRALALFLILGALSFLERLAVLGALALAF